MRCFWPRRRVHWSPTRVCVAFRPHGDEVMRTPRAGAARLPRVDRQPVGDVAAEMALNSSTLCGHSAICARMFSASRAESSRPRGCCRRRGPKEQQPMHRCSARAVRPVMAHRGRPTVNPAAAPADARIAEIHRGRPPRRAPLQHPTASSGWGAVRPRIDQPLGRCRAPSALAIDVASGSPAGSSRPYSSRLTRSDGVSHRPPRPGLRPTERDHAAAATPSNRKDTECSRAGVPARQQPWDRKTSASPGSPRSDSPPDHHQVAARRSPTPA